MFDFEEGKRYKPRGGGGETVIRKGVNIKKVPSKAAKLGRVLVLSRLG